MIKELKIGEECFYFHHSYVTYIECITLNNENYKIFINDENFVHNDVGPAWGNGFGYISYWFWNGIRVR